MNKAFSANFSDLSGATNPTGIWSPAYLRLKMALDRGDAPDNVLQALYDWMSEKNIQPTRVEKILELPSAEHAYEALLTLIGGKLRTGQPTLSASSMPPMVKQTLRRAIQTIAQRHVARGEQELATAQSQLDTIKGRFSSNESVTRLVDGLLGS